MVLPVDEAITVGEPESDLGVGGLDGIRSVDDVTADIDAKVATDCAWYGVFLPPIFGLSVSEARSACAPLIDIVPIFHALLSLQIGDLGGIIPLALVLVGGLECHECRPFISGNVVFNHWPGGDVIVPPFLF